MKKLVIVALAVFLAMPVLSHAAAVNSRWDMTIGGYVMTQMGWADQSVGSGYKNASRDNGARENERNERSNMFSHVEGRLNFIVRGPDTWGAKSTGRLEFDFLGAAGEPIGDAVLRHAYMTFDWANSQLLIGNTWYGWQDVGMPPPGGTVASLPNAGVPSRSPQVRWTQRFGKNFTTFIGLEYPGLGRWMAAGNDYYDDYTRSDYPNIYSAVIYKSDACGVLGPMRLTVGTSGVYGRKIIPRSYSSTGPNARGTVYSEKQEDGWIAQVFAYVPIIPQAKDQNKKFGLGVYGALISGQGLSNFNAQTLVPTYARPSVTNGVDTSNYSTPVGYAWYAGAQFYLTNELWITAQYNNQQTQISNYWRSQSANLNTPVRTQLYNIGLMYDPNPAVRLGVEYTRLVSGYAAPGYVAGGGNTYAFSKQGTLNTIRLSGQYLF